MQPEDRLINGQPMPDRAWSANPTRPPESPTDLSEQHADWRRMVIFSDHREAVASAVITLYRAALASADTPIGDAPLYLRRMQNSICQPIQLLRQAGNYLPNSLSRVRFCIV